MKKPRCDAPLNRLTEGNDDLREEIIARAAKEPHTDVRAWLRKQHGIKIGATAYYEWLRGQRMRKLVLDANSSAHAFREFVKAFDSDLSPQDVERIADLKFSLDAAGSGDAETYAKIQRLVLARRREAAEAKEHGDQMAVAEKRLVLSREHLQLKVKQLEAALEKTRKVAASVSRDLRAARLDKPTVERIRGAVLRIALGRK